jgi:hypothetical protein
MYLFGGILSKNLDYEKNNFNKSYAANNFNDYLNSFVICFELTVVNNWNYIVYVHSTYANFFCP